MGWFADDIDLGTGSNGHVMHPFLAAVAIYYKRRRGEFRDHNVPRNLLIMSRIHRHSQPTNLCGQNTNDAPLRSLLCSNGKKACFRIGKARFTI